MKKAVNLANDPYMIKTTAPENEYIQYEGDITRVIKPPYCTSGLWSDNGKIDNINDISYEEYMKVVHENELLKQIIVELNKQLYGGKNDK